MNTLIMIYYKPERDHSGRHKVTLYIILIVHLIQFVSTFSFFKFKGWYGHKIVIYVVFVTSLAYIYIIPRFLTVDTVAKA